MPVHLPDTVEAAVAQLAEDADRHRVGGRHRRDGRGERRASTARPHRRGRQPDRRAPVVATQRCRADGHDRCGGQLSGVGDRTARRAVPGARAGGADRRFPTDPQRRHARREPGDLLASRRRTSRAGGAGRRRGVGRTGRSANDAGHRLHGRREAHGAGAGRDDRVGHAAARARAGRDTPRSGFATRW